MASSQRLMVAAHELGGNNRGPLLLLLHANGFHGRTFLPMLPVLAPHFNCVALDLPGHGIAPCPNSPFTKDDLLEAVRGYVEAHGIQGCYCFGHSLGGAMAALLQHERPQTFRALFLFEPVIRPFRELEERPIGEPPPPPLSTSPQQQQQPEANIASQAAPSGGAGVGSGCAPPPSLDPASPRSARPDSLLARIARKRQAVYPSVEAAKASLGAKPPFKTFHPEALHAYLSCGGLRPLNSASPTGGGSSEAATAAGSPVTLSCSPETEARVYEALEPPPWRPWQQLTAGFGSQLGCCCGCNGSCRSGAGCIPHRGCGGAGEDGTAASSGCFRTSGAGGGARREDRPAGRQPCRLAIAVGREVGLHAALARWGAAVAELVPGTQLIRFSDLYHLGPMEDPQRVAQAALQFFFQPDHPCCENLCGGGSEGGHEPDGASAGPEGLSARSKM